MHAKQRRRVLGGVARVPLVHVRILDHARALGQRREGLDDHAHALHARRRAQKRVERTPKQAGDTHIIALRSTKKTIR